MRKVFSVLAVMAALFIGGWAQEAGAQTERTFTVTNTTNPEVSNGNDANLEFDLTGIMADLTGGLEITDVDLRLDVRNVSSGRVSDLVAHIVHPDGDRVELFNRIYVTGFFDLSLLCNGNRLNNHFDDDAVGSISCPIQGSRIVSTGRVRPQRHTLDSAQAQQRLADFNGKSPNFGGNHTWRLTVRDVIANSSRVRVHSAELIIKATPTGPIGIVLTSGDSDNTINEGENVTFTVTLNEPASGNVNVPITITPSSANIAYTAPELTSGNLLISNGQTTGTFTVTATEDNMHEPDGTIIVALGTAPTGYFNYNSADSVTINVNNDDDPTVSLTSGDSDNTINESESVTFTVTLAEAAVGNVNVPITITASSADIAYTAPELTNGSLLISNGQTTGNFTVTATNDDDDEPDGTITVALGAAPTGYTNDNSANSVIITVNDDDPQNIILTITRDNDSRNEGVDVVFTITASPPPSAPLTVNVLVTEGGGRAPGWISGPPPATVVIPMDQSSAKLVVPTAGDGVDEFSGHITATLQPGDYRFDETNSDPCESGTNPRCAQVRVFDQDFAAATISAPPSVLEGESIEVVVSLSTEPHALQSGNNHDSRLIVAMTTEDASGFLQSGQATDFTLNLNRTTLTHSFTVPTMVNNTPGNGTLTFHINNSPQFNSWRPGNPRMVTVTVNDTNRISLTSGDSDDTINEGENVTFTVTLAEAASGNVNVPITITPSSADIAYTVPELTSGSLLISNGETTGTFTVMATEDSIDEPDGTITVALGTAPSGGYVNDSSANSVTITVNDNDARPVMTIKGFERDEAPYVTVVEGEDVVIVLSLDKPAPVGATTSIRAALRVGNSHGTTTSTDRDDFDAVAFQTDYSDNTLDLFDQVGWEFAEGEQELTIRIRTVDDSTAREFTENAAYPMFGASNLDVGHPFSGLFTIPIYIIDNDP
ncbi:MAG: hypothetical protein OXF42_04970, partial [Candidatus Dadabacteria bacterium]|nr:hypothetical protein [Candidatus Dadabacteria bacterium]